MSFTRFHVARLLRGAACVSLLSLSQTASAANANFEVTVEPVSASASSAASVSLGRNGLTTYAAYKVSITNTSGNTNNAIRFSASTNVSGDFKAGTTANAPPVDAGAVAPYVEVTGTTACTGSGSGVSCYFAQMKDQANNTFVVIFSAPALGEAESWDESTAAMRLAWEFDYASGNSSGATSSLLCGGVRIAAPPCRGVGTTALITTVTDAILSSFVTYIPTSGGTFFTGNGASVLPPIGLNLRPTAAAKIKVPEKLGLTTAKVDLTVVSGAVSAGTTTTITAVMQVPNGDKLFANYATIELRRDASTLSGGAKIANAVVSYSHEEINPDFKALKACPTGGVPSQAEPVCIADRKEYTRKTAPTPDDIGDWLFIIHALENGIARW